MSERIVREPGVDHPITIGPEPERVVVRVGGTTIADTNAALTLREAAYAPVRYIAREHVDMGALVRSRTTTYCPYKGVASYFSIPAGGSRSIDAAWTYEAPHAAVAAIAGRLAFYPDRVDPEDCRSGTSRPPTRAKPWI